MRLLLLYLHEKDTETIHSKNDHGNGFESNSLLEMKKMLQMQMCVFIISTHMLYTSPSLSAIYWYLPLKPNSQ